MLRNFCWRPINDHDTLPDGIKVVDFVISAVTTWQPQSWLLDMDLLSYFIISNASRCQTQSMKFQDFVLKRQKLCIIQQKQIKVLSNTWIIFFKKMKKNSPKKKHTFQPSSNLWQTLNDYLYFSRVYGEIDPHCNMYVLQLTYTFTQKNAA